MSLGAHPPATPTIWLWRVAIVVGWAAILAGLAMFGWDCLMWLRDGSWSRESVSDLWGQAPIVGDEGAGWQEMRGLHRILHALLRWSGRCPLSLALILFGLALAWLGNGRHDHAERARARRGRSVRAPRRG